MAEFAAIFSMRTLDRSSRTTHLGLATVPGILEFMESSPGVSFEPMLETPFEQLRHSPELAQIQQLVPLVLHCASMSVAGFVPPSEATIEAICLEAERTKTPWIGEHLAFVSADGINEEPDRDTAPTNLTYTLCPQLSEETVGRVAANLASLQPRFSVPLILENSPQYYPISGSTMNMVDFVCEWRRAARSICSLT